MSTLEFLDDVVRRRVKLLREEAGWTQDEFAGRLRALGFDEWTRPVLATLEWGRRRVLARDLFAFAAALRCSVADLICDPGGSRVEVRLSDRTKIRTSSLLYGLHQRLGLGGLRVSEGEAFSPAIEGAAVSASARLLDLLIGELAPDVPEQVLDAEGRGDFEGRLAGEITPVLGPAPLHDPRVVVAASRSLWGRSATEERRLRVERRSISRQRAGTEIRREIAAVIDSVLPRVIAAVRLETQKRSKGRGRR